MVRVTHCLLLNVGAVGTEAEQRQGEEGPELVGVKRLEDAICIAFEDVQGPAPAGAGEGKRRTVLLRATMSD